MVENKLCLGTVQFGLNYGINNFAGKPSKKDVFRMLDEAVNNGITWFDTAMAYGDAENLLGEYGVFDKNVKIVSKLQPNLIDEACLQPEAVIEEQVLSSLKRMGLKCLDGYLLHTPENIYNNRIMKGLSECKGKGFIKHFGVSVYETQHALDAVKGGLIDYIQVPYNIFDQRLDRTPFFQLAKKKGVTVFARSAFLQGLILMSESQIPDHLTVVKGYLREFDKIIKEFDYSRIEAAFLFSYSHSYIDYVVFGVDQIDHLRQILQITKGFDMERFMGCRIELSRHFANMSKNIIFPSLWAKKK